jgi:HPt (histidine-containing phosphotransfer) domain-containing protein
MSNTPHSDGSPPFALAELLDRCMGSVDVAVLVLDKFEVQLREDIGAIAGLLAAKDSGQLACTAHALKGAAGAVAAKALHGLAAQVESSAKHDQLDAIDREFASLRSEVDRCLSHIPAARRALVSGSAAPSVEAAP